MVQAAPDTGQYVVQKVSKPQWHMVQAVHGATGQCITQAAHGAARQCMVRMAQGAAWHSSVAPGDAGAAQRKWGPELHVAHSVSSAEHRQP